MEGRGERRAKRFAGAELEHVGFLAARPIWPAAREKEKNLLVGFRASFNAPIGRGVLLRLAASSLYRAFLNGEFLSHGPARGPHGYFRVDELDLTDQLRSGSNVVAIEVAGYNVNGYYLLDQAAFLQAEVLCDGRALAATGRRDIDFAVTLLRERVQKVERYSFQRPFSELYHLQPGHDAWRERPTARIESVRWSEQPPKALLPRRVPYPTFSLRRPTWHVASGQLQPGQELQKPFKSGSLTGIGPQLGGFLEEELEAIPSIELQHVATIKIEQLDGPLPPRPALKLQSNSYHIVDFGTNLTGFLGAQVACRKQARLFLLFDELLREGDVDPKRLHCANVVAYELQPGGYRVESFEPYTLRYLKVALLEGEATVEQLWLRELANPSVWSAHFAASDERLNRLFEAGRETFRQNATDIFMDCPSRERAGWLCDSFFTARVALDLCGEADIEHNFYENFLLPREFANLPNGMLPMCYPSDHYNGVFIPNWALWFVVQLEEYLARSGDRTTLERLRARVLALFGYFKRFENPDGLLEKLESWVFIEWSKANEFVQDLNFPSNMLYAGALAAAGRLYGLRRLEEKANAIRETIRRQSFDGQFFVDNAVRTDGQLQVTRNRTETCQYYAFFFDVATPQSHPELWRTLCEQFGPRRKDTKAFPEIWEANSFIGNMLRIEILSRYGRGQQILDESVDYLLYMADRTGTLWENVGDYASCNHGFASHIVHTLYRDILGIHRVDPVGKKLHVRLGDAKLSWCRGRIPLPQGAICLSWRREGERLVYSVDMPSGWDVEVENLSGCQLVREP